MGKLRWYKRDPDAALQGMAELTLKQRGAYNSLLDLLYSRDGNVPDDDIRVARMIACHWREWAAVKKELIAAGKVWTEETSEGVILRAKRVQEALKEAADFSQEQRKRAAKRWHGSENASEINGTSMPLPAVPPGNALTTTTTTREERPPIHPPKAEPRQAQRDETEQAFEEWYRAYPRRTGRGQALKAYRTALKKTDHDDLVLGAQAYAQAMRGTEQRFVKHPATWLNGECWLDETEPPDDEPILGMGLVR